MVNFKRVLLLLLLVLFYSGSASAIVYDNMFTDPVGMGTIDGTDYIVIEDGSPSTLTIFHTDTSSTSTKMVNLPQLDDAVVLPNEKMALVFQNGDVYLFDYDTHDGIYDWNDHAPEDDMTLLGQIGTTDNHNLLADAGNNIYVSAGTQIFKFTSPNYSYSLWDTATRSIRSMDNHPDGIIVGTYQDSSTGKYTVELHTGSSSQTIRTADYESSDGVFGINVASNGDLYCFDVCDIFGQHKTLFFKLDADNSYAYSEKTLIDDWILDTELSDTGLIYGVSKDDDVIRTYSTDDNIGRYVPFPLGEPEEDTGITFVEWELSEYTTGDTASINVSISDNKWDIVNYTYYLNIYDHAIIKNTQTLTEQNSTKPYTFEQTQIASSFLAQVRRQHTNGTVETLASGLTSFYETGTSYAVTFDKDAYSKTDTMNMLYSDAPANTTLYLQGWDADIDQNVYENTWTVSGSGSQSVTVPNPNAESYTVRIIYDGYILDSDYCEISTATESHLYGVVYNAATGARIEGAEVAIDDTYKLTDEIGAYSWIVETGEHDVSCALDGFQTISYDDYMISGDKEVNFYLSPNAVGDSVYVMVKDYETKAPIQNAHVIVYNDTMTVGDYASNTGLVELSVPDGTYTLKVVKDGYDNIEKTIDTSASSFFDVLMASGSYNPNAPGAGGLAEDETLTDYYNARFREFAPTAWGFFLLVIVLYLLSILTSFGGSKSRR